VTDCTERSEGQEGMPSQPSVTDCTERSEGQEGMPGQPSVTDCTERGEGQEGMPSQPSVTDCTERSEGSGMTYTLLGPDRRPYPSAVPGRLGGHRRTRVYGRLDCPSALRAIAAGGYLRHRVFFAHEATTIAAGYRPCGACLPATYAAWRASTPDRWRAATPDSRQGSRRDCAPGP
jgi:hypothetical protein